MNERILLIDDDANVLGVMSEALTQAGYQPRTMRNSQDALDLLRQEPFDLVVSDIVMPDLHGIDLLAAAKRLNPAIKVLFVTGYANRQIVQEGFDKGACGFLEKPFSLGEFSDAVRTVLAD
ncbi:MAG TPA: response regulator [Candidatus Tectomicrobia bacterium]|nr:response regulator [Candidatus Tectomicrobia bacterium]